MSKIAVLLLLIALTPGWAADPPPASKRPPHILGYTALQLGRGRQNHLLLRTKVNGQPVLFMLDSGAPVSLLDARKAKKLKLASPPPRSGIPAEITSGGETRQVAWANDFRAGEMIFGPGPLMTMDDFSSNLSNFKTDHGNVDGIIGWDILHRYKAVLNCRTQQIYFHTDPAVRTHLDETLRRAGYSSVSMVEEKDKLFIPCEVAGRQLRMIVDTGAFTTTLQQSRMKELGIRTEVTNTMAGGVSIKFARVSITKNLPQAHLSIAGVPINQNLVVHSENLAIFGSDLLGLVGGDVLGLYSVIIDFEKLRFYIHPMSAAAKVK